MLISIKIGYNFYSFKIIMSVNQSPVELWPSVQREEAAFVLLGMNFHLLTCPLLIHMVVLVSAFLFFSISYKIEPVLTLT